MAKLLSTDEFGNSMKPRDYKDLTTGDLSRITEAICVRLHLFNGEYPAFLPQTVRAIMEHPNLSGSDYDKMNTFSRMFELDWRGDRAIENKMMFMATNPIYLSEKDRPNTFGVDPLGNFEVTTFLRLACTPFVP